MEDITSEISVNIISETSFEVIFANTPTSISIYDPLIYDNSNNLIGNSIGESNIFNIEYTNQEYYGNVKIVIPALSMLVDSNKTNLNDIEAIIIKTIPVVNYTFPSVLPVIGFDTGVNLKIQFTNFPSGRVPLTISSAVNITSVQLSSNLFYHLGDLYFVSPELYGVYYEEIRLLPEPGTGSLGDTITFSVDNASNVTQVPASLSTYIYNIISTFTPTTINNIVLNGTTFVWEYSTECLIFSDLQVPVFTIDVSSVDYEPTFELRNFMTLFTVTPESLKGVVSKNIGTPAGTYPLDIVVRTRFGEELFIILTVCIDAIITVSVPTTVENLIQNGSTLIWEYPEPCLTVSNLHESFFTIDTTSIDCMPTYELRNFTTLFTVNKGVVSKISNIPIGTYPLDIVIRTSFGEELFIILNVCVVDIFSEGYFLMKSGDPCNSRCMSVDLEFYCPDGENTRFTLGVNTLKSISDIAKIFLRVIDFTLQKTISPNFKTTNTDIIQLVESLLCPSERQFEFLIKNKFDIILCGSRLEYKIDYYVTSSFQFFRKVLLRYMNFSDTPESFNMTSEFKYKLEIVQK